MILSPRKDSQSVCNKLNSFDFKFMTQLISKLLVYFSFSSSYSVQTLRSPLPQFSFFYFVTIPLMESLVEYVYSIFLVGCTYPVRTNLPLYVYICVTYDTGSVFTGRGRETICVLKVQRDRTNLFEERERKWLRVVTLKSGVES